MGADFARKTAKTHIKAWDKMRLKLATPDLFSITSTCEGRAMNFDMVSGGPKLSEGDQLIVAKNNGSLIARRGLTEVARATSVPAEIMKAVENGCGLATGTIQQINKLSGTMEISLC